MTNSDLGTIQLAIKIGDQNPGVDVVGKTHEDTVKNLLNMFKVGNGDQANNKSPR